MSRPCCCSAADMLVLACLPACVLQAPVLRPMPVHLPAAVVGLPGPMPRPLAALVVARPGPRPRPTRMQGVARPEPGLRQRLLHVLQAARHGPGLRQAHLRHLAATASCCDHCTVQQVQHAREVLYNQVYNSVCSDMSWLITANVMQMITQVVPCGP